MLIICFTAKIFINAPRECTFSPYGANDKLHSDGAQLFVMEYWKNKSLADINGELWKPIDFLEKIKKDTYLVSNYSRIKSVKRLFFRKSSGMIYEERERIVCQSSDCRHGYLKVFLYNEKHIKQLRVHRVVAEAFLPNPENKPFVCHNDDTPWHNWVDNLFWGTPQENTADMVRKNRHTYGDKVHTSKLNNRDIASIRSLLIGGGITQQEIGEIFGVDQTTISCLKIGLTWKNVP